MLSFITNSGTSFRSLKGRSIRPSLRYIQENLLQYVNRLLRQLKAYLTPCHRGIVDCFVKWLTSYFNRRAIMKMFLHSLFHTLFVVDNCYLHKIIDRVLTIVRLVTSRLIFFKKPHLSCGAASRRQYKVTLASSLKHFSLCFCHFFTRNSRWIILMRQIFTSLYNV